MLLERAAPGEVWARVAVATLQLTALGLSGCESSAADVVWNGDWEFTSWSGGPGADCAYPPVPWDSLRVDTTEGGERVAVARASTAVVGFLIGDEPATDTTWSATVWNDTRFGDTAATGTWRASATEQGIAGDVENPGGEGACAGSFQFSAERVSGLPGPSADDWGGSWLVRAGPGSRVSVADLQVNGSEAAWTQEDYCAAGWQVLPGGFSDGTYWTDTVIDVPSCSLNYHLDLDFASGGGTASVDEWCSDNGRGISENWTLERLNHDLFAGEGL